MPLVALSLVIFAFIGEIFLGLFTFYKNPKSATNKLFFLFATSFAIYILFNYLIPLQTLESSAFFWVKMVMFIAVLINITFYLLATTFPKNRLDIKAWKLVLYLIWTIVLLPFPFLNLIFTSVTVVGSATGGGNPGLGMPLFLLHTIFFLGGGIVSLIKKFRKSTGVEKAQIKLFLSGAIFMFSALLITNLLFIILFNNSQFIGLLPVYSLIFVGSISYAIVRHRFLDISLLVARAVSYSLLFFILIFIYAVLIFATTEILPLGINRTILSVGSALLVAFSFNPLRTFLQRATDKILFKGRYETEKLLAELTRIMASEIEIDTLSDKLLKTILSEMRLTKGAVILVENHKVTSVKTVGFKDEKSMFDKQLEKLLHKNTPSYLLEELVGETEKNLFRSVGISIALPLRVKGKEIGLLVLGQKASGEIYNNQDIEVLEIFAPQAAVALQNAQRYEEIRQFSEKLKVEVKKATADLQVANKKLKELDKQKDEFINVAAHELRSPITAIKGYISMIIEGDAGEITDKARGYLVDANAVNERLVRLINNMLNVSRIEEGRIVYQEEEVNLARVAKSTHDSFKFESQRKNLEFNLDIPPDIKDTVRVDSDRINEVVGNFVSNAVKFTEKGSIDIKLSNPTKDTIRLEIIDTGPGITESEQKRLFAKFYRTESTAGKTIGTGLGLYISKLLVEAFEGKIGLDSEFGKGSNFWFELPLVEKKSKTKV